jgi:transcriptional regulator with XRE-family HTH domain
VVATVNDDTDQAVVDDTDQAIVRAIGEELRRARMSAGWSRPELIKRMKTRIPVNTYACYEQGIRQCSIPRLVEICQALDTDMEAPELIGRALQRLGLRRATTRCDLGALLRTIENQYRSETPNTHESKT